VEFLNPMMRNASSPTRRELLLQNVFSSSKCHHYHYFGTKKGESLKDW
jgi:hypothetical protein